jgi:hypothetical protein
VKLKGQHERRESCVAFLEKDEKTLQKGVENDKITFLNSQEGSSLVCCGIQHGNDIVHKMKKMKKGRFKIPFHYMLTKLTTKHALLSSYAIIYETRTRDREFFLHVKNIWIFAFFNSRVPRE